jgi:mRNA-degrading endonuclease YafQ of YafQ-DinJ toxin-antitoxin module
MFMWHGCECFLTLQCIPHLIKNFQKERKDAEHLSLLSDSVSDKHPLEFVGQVHQIVCDFVQCRASHTLNNCSIFFRYNSILFLLKNEQLNSSKCINKRKAHF